MSHLLVISNNPLQFLEPAFPVTDRQGFLQEPTVAMTFVPVASESIEVIRSGVTCVEHLIKPTLDSK